MFEAMTLADLYKVFKSSAGVCTDTRKAKPNTLFFALKGDRFNGNEYALEALNSGCSRAVVDEEEYAIDKRFILVDDVLATLQNLAHYHRKQSVKGAVLAITGSNGKTTTKELLYQVLSHKAKTYATPGNLNNHIGLPLCLLEVTEEHEFILLEMGDNKMGDVTELCDIALPEYGILTNIGKDHIGGFGSMQHNILAKKEIIDFLQKTKGHFFFNQDDELIGNITPEGLEVTRYSKSIPEIEQVQSWPYVTYSYLGNEVKTNMAGDYNMLNITLAISVARHFKVDEEMIHTAIGNYTPANMRSQVVNTAGGPMVVLDAYNANPSSVELALRSFAKARNKDSWVILGDMRELGPISTEEHAAIIDLVNELGIIHALFIGDEFYAVKRDLPGFLFFNSKEEASDFLFDKNWTGDQSVLIKGSRGLKLESLQSCFLADNANR